MRPLTFLVSAAFILLGLSAYGGDLKDTNFGFSVKIPDPFKDVGKGADPNTLYQFTDGEPAPGKMPRVIIIQRMHGTIAKEGHMKPSDIPLPPGGKATIEKFKWNDLNLELTRVIYPIPDGGSLVVYGTQYPLPKEAVQLQVGGSMEHDAELRKLFETLAGSLVSLEDVK